MLMKIGSKLLNVGYGHIVLLFGCVSQGGYDLVVKVCNDLATQNRVLKDNLSKSQKVSIRSRTGFVAAKRPLDASNRVIIKSHGNLADTRSRVMTATSPLKIV